MVASVDKVNVRGLGPGELPSRAGRRRSTLLAKAGSAASLASLPPLRAIAIVCNEAGSHGVANQGRLAGDAAIAMWNIASDMSPPRQSDETLLFGKLKNALTVHVRCQEAAQCKKKFNHRVCLAAMVMGLVVPPAAVAVGAALPAAAALGVGAEQAISLAGDSRSIERRVMGDNASTDPAQVAASQVASKAKRSNIKAAFGNQGKVRQAQAEVQYRIASKITKCERGEDGNVGLEVDLRSSSNIGLVDAIENLQSTSEVVELDGTSSFATKVKFSELGASFSGVFDCNRLGITKDERQEFAISTFFNILGVLASHANQLDKSTGVSSEVKEPQTVNLTVNTDHGPVVVELSLDENTYSCLLQCMHVHDKLGVYSKTSEGHAIGKLAKNLKHGPGKIEMFKSIKPMIFRKKMQGKQPSTTPSDKADRFSGTNPGV